MCETQGDSRSRVAKHGQTQGGPSKIVCSRNRISGRVIEPNRGRARSLEQARLAVRWDRARQFLLPGRTPFFPRSLSFKKNTLVLPRSKNDQEDCTVMTTKASMGGSAAVLGRMRQIETATVLTEGGTVRGAGDKHARATGPRPGAGNRRQACL